jgi:Amt family ammonium transporter
VNPAGADGLLYGNAGQLITQATGVLAGWALAAVGTFVILKLVGLITPLRVSEEEEIAGLDLSMHGEVAYNFFGPGASSASRVTLAQESSFSGSPAIENASSEN